ncbi:MAG: hypothetical protein GXO99_02680, partial [Nitrospirae bacterium]|nr:hypothetical protein [Nitrospirota bacterium]
MKRILLIIIILGLSIAFVGSIEAATISAATSIGTTPFTPSRGVGVNLLSQAAAYTATSADYRGTYQFCTGGGNITNGDSAKIYKKSYTHSGTLTYGN